MSRRFRRQPPAAVVTAAILGLIVAGRACYDLFPRQGPVRLDEPPAEGHYEVVRVVDGDTLIILYPSSARSGDVADADAAADSEKVRVRLIGIDAPESVKPDHPVEPFGPEAAEFARQFVSQGPARLRFDRRKLDKYGRVLAYVYVGDVMLNEELVRRGLARAVHYPGDSDSLARRIRAAEQEARASRLGIWSLQSRR
jgi:micrococcal nuclease